MVDRVALRPVVYLVYRIESFDVSKPRILMERIERGLPSISWHPRVFFYVVLLNEKFDLSTVEITST